ncbi:Fe-S cluster assembly sulfur transfer protein SufU [Levilactobacillus zymae]|uniref:Iron-sulfur cluster assembly scaffold protein n=1 Tax=Levilactobacillus zymae TaxID=267363 RepID=A0A1Y6JZQ4_9LACO|nr:SUF system NifU family Fe-S cluster assembly protein [Levilactobacillus zymae]KRL12690.1 NifU-like protein [Levilactobacillus zymae DSM 19395]QFR62000.1 SUF system NifU family Fe-S cluster assembly protein [Levilactobacillus zymae]GEO72409.1 iron-sulfur cluster assembly scaffold protein [Levilactobacillus zymae]SMS15429.1 Putative iron-sulfur cluster assembly scaffold protein for SUF system, SufE2 [Levilactobacillus zymae]
MGLSKLNSLYREVILDHSDHPHHKHALADSTSTITLKNPTCGDVINLDVKLDATDHIEDIGFTGDGCTISQSSASMMTDAVMGKSKEEALHMAKTFSDMVMGKEHPQADLDQLQDAAILSSIMQFPARIKCATLSWWALQRALMREEDQATKED